MTNWIIQCTDGTFLKLNGDTGLCDRFLYLDLKKHKDAVAMIKTIRKNYEGYTKLGVREAILACKAQSKHGNPAQKEFIKMLRSKSGVKSIPVNPNVITNDIWHLYYRGVRKTSK